MPRKPPSHNQFSSATSKLHKTLELSQHLLQEKKYKKAMAVCRRYLATTPNSPDILNLAGTISYHDRRWREAVDYFRQAIQLAPDKSVFHFNLANTLAKSGHTDDAISAYKYALNLAPDNQKLLASLGSIYANSGKMNAAARVYERLLGLNAYHAQALDYLESYYKNLPDSDPSYIAALKNLGAILIQTDRPEEAIGYFVHANRLSPDDIDIMMNLAYTYYLLGKPENAEPIYRKTIKLRPDFAPLYLSLGTVLNHMGNTTEAISCYRNALSIDPTCVQAHAELSYIIKHKTYDDDIRTMEETLKNPTLNTGQKSCLNFGLGKAYEDLQDYDKAFNHYFTANQLKRNKNEYDIAKDRQLFENITSKFNAELYARLENRGHHDDGPIFIVGMPRSGTTLVEQILASHPDVHGAGELKQLGYLIYSYFNQKFGAIFPENAHQLDASALKELGLEYCEIISHHANTRYITNKMPQNFRYIGLIRLMLPNAKIIHCVRNPIDTCFSCYTTDFSEGHGYSSSLDELGQYYGLYYQLMQHWQKLPGIGLIDICYERLIDDQEAQTRYLLDACGLKWNDACLNFQKSDRSVMTASVNQVRNGLYRKSIERWKHFQAHLTPLIESLGKTLPIE